jgi:hypothetical protein
LADAANRLQARGALLHLQTTLAAVAACWSDKGQALLRRTRRSLEKQAGH